MSQDVLQVTRDRSVAILTMNRPEAKNALSFDLTDALLDQLVALRRDETVRSVVLTGGGGNFSSGGDVKTMGRLGDRTPEQRRQGMQRYRDLAVALMNLDKPLIAAVDGVAYGAGLSMALTADMVLVSERVRMCVVFHRIGLVPDVGAWFNLPRIVGLQRAKELVFSAREFNAAEALQMGVAMEVLSPDALLPRALAIAHSFEGAPPTALSLSKQALQASLQSDLTTMLDMEATAQAVAGSSAYARESVRRFAAKEPAQFKWPTREA